ncbi:MAG: hypothetical protein Kow00106_06460 [Anaerolineae bacterium]
MLRFLGTLIALLVVIAIILVWSLALGWLLTRVLPLDLFQGALLAMVASAISAYALFNIPRLGESEWDYAGTSYDIPIERFIASEADRTWANWARLEIANTILDVFRRSLEPGTLDAAELEERAVLLSGAAMAILRRKSAHSSTLEITEAQLRNQLQRMKLEPLDDAVLRAAVEGINLAVMAPPIVFAARKQVWDQPAPILDVEK